MLSPGAWSFRSAGETSGALRDGRHSGRLLVLSHRRLDSLVEHDVFGKPASILGTSPRAGFFQIML
jgi:hypothetical protein